MTVESQHLKSNTDSSYMPQLDGLRALAVLAVLVHHFGGTAVPSWLDVGRPAVRLFFVLSGFLVTSILLRSRRHVEEDNGNYRDVFRTFYARRTLRIFPAYYFALALAVTAGIEVVLNSIWWHVTYLSNFYIALKGHWPRAVSHLWSLAVEEQFYLVWPFVIIMLPKRLLRLALLIIVIAAPIFRGVIYSVTENWATSSVLMPACLDCLGAGALLALFHSNNNSSEKSRSLTIFGLSGAAVVALMTCLRWANIGHMAQIIALDVGYAALFVWVVDFAARDRLSSLLACVTLRFIGRISYGIYLYHLFLPELIWDPGPALADVLPLKLAFAGRVCYFTAVSILVATVSWFVIERPLNQLKSRFRYTPSEKRPVQVPDIAIQEEANIA